MCQEPAWRRATATPEALSALIDDESWLTAAEAADLGLVDEVTEPLQIAATLTPEMARRFQKMPTAIVVAKNGEIPTEDPLTADDETTPAEEGAPVTPPPTTTTNSTAAQITELCITAGVAALAPGLIRAGTTVDDARPIIIAARATKDEAINHHPPQPTPPAPSAQISAAHIYARRNR